MSLVAAALNAGLIWDILKAKPHMMNTITDINIMDVLVAMN